jgi:glycosyltransferase involved in cell wall biosynthesis
MIRVLHVVENFNGQAVESWLTRVVNHEGFDSGRLHFDFFLLGVGPGEQADGVLRKGCVLHEGNSGGASIPQMARALRRVVKQGNYAIVHIHKDVLAGVFALALIGTGVSVITQAHNCLQRLPVGGYWKERVLTIIARWLALRLSSTVVGVSTCALQKLTGGKHRTGRSDRVIYCGADAERFLHAVADREDFRKTPDLPQDALILLFVGRLVPEKSPEFVLDVLSELRKIEPRAAGVFVGKGAEEDSLRARVEELGLEDAVRFLGWRADVPEIMCCSDWFIHSGPESPMEGFGLVALEAQLAGLRLLLSKGIPDDVFLPGSCHRQLSVSEPAGIWAREANALLKERPATREEAAAALADTRMEQNTAFAELLGLYQQ